MKCEVADETEEVLCFSTLHFTTLFLSLLLSQKVKGEAGIAEGT